MGGNSLIDLVREREEQKHLHRKAISKDKCFNPTSLFHIDYSPQIKLYTARTTENDYIKYLEHDNSVVVPFNNQHIRLDYEDWFCWFRYYSWNPGKKGLPYIKSKSILYYFYSVRGLNIKKRHSNNNPLDLRKRLSLNYKRIDIPLGVWKCFDGSYDVWLIAPGVQTLITNTDDSLFTAAAFYNRAALEYKPQFAHGWHNYL